MNFRLTKEITARDVLRISLPMMISSLSSHFMLILDQLVLARHSIEAMVGASSASVWSAALQCSIMSITIAAGAFVGNYNGAQKYKIASIPVWQMIWFSMALFSLSIPLSIFAGDLCIPEELKEQGLPYFQILMVCAPITGVYYTLSSFFVAIGKGMYVTFSVIIANIVNLIVDIILVFGYFGIDKFQGAKGAALGTVFAWLVNGLILFGLFLKKDIREKYGTLNFKLHMKKMKDCLKLGIVGGIGHIFEMSAWSVIYYLLASVGREVAMVQSIAVSVNIFLAFIVSGLEKGVMAITSNLLGSKMKEKMKFLLKKGLIVHFTFIAIISPFFLFYPELISKHFIKFDVSPETIERTFFVLKLVLLYLSFDGVCWVVAGVLEGGGDINYTMVTIATCLWVFVTLPALILSKLQKLSVEITWTLLIVAVVSISAILYHRYKSNKWIHIKV